MKKTNVYSNLDLLELQTKQQEFIKDLVCSRISMDLTDLKSATNLQNLLRDLKKVTRILAIKKKSAKKEVIDNANR